MRLLGVTIKSRHRAATTGSTGFISLLLKPSENAPKTRLNTADRIGKLSFADHQDRMPTNNTGQGNTPLHLAMESGHADAAVLLIEAGADRHRVRIPLSTSRDEAHLQNHNS